MENMGKRPFFLAAMAGMGKYCTGGYGQIGVYRDFNEAPTTSESHYFKNKNNPIQLTLLVLLLIHG